MYKRLRYKWHIKGQDPLKARNGKKTRHRCLQILLRINVRFKVRVKRGPM